MNKDIRVVDRIQQRLTDYACQLDFDALPAETVHAAKALTVDTLGGLIDGFHFEPCRIARNLAAAQPSAEGATVIGTRIRTTMDMAAFANATTARYLEANDVYARFKPGSAHGHPSDVILPLLAVAEHARASGRDFITSVVLGYEVYLRICDVFHNDGFDTTIYGCAAIAAGAGRLLGLSPMQLSHCISMAVVPNNILRQVRQSHITMWNAVAAGHVGRAGVFAAMQAKAGMDGPHLPFEGKGGWCDHVARERFSLGAMGGEEGQPFLIMGARIKPRPVCAYAMPSTLAAEKVRPALKDVNDVTEVTAEVFRGAYRMADEHHWHPESRETAGHSIPYSVAVALIDGEVSTRSFDDAHLRNAVLRGLMPKIKVVENETFTRAFEGPAQQYRARITVVMDSGERIVGESGGDEDDLAAPKNDAQVARKFHGHVDALLGKDRADRILQRLWRLDAMDSMAAVPPDFLLD